MGGACRPAAGHAQPRRRPWRDAICAFVFDAFSFLERLAALVSHPRERAWPFHGSLAPASTFRDRIVPPAQSAGASPQDGEQPSSRRTCCTNDRADAARPSGRRDPAVTRRTQPAWQTDLMARLAALIVTVIAALAWAFFVSGEDAAADAGHRTAGNLEPSALAAVRDLRKGMGAQDAAAQREALVPPGDLLDEPGTPHKMTFETSAGLPPPLGLSAQLVGPQGESIGLAVPLTDSGVATLEMPVPSVRPLHVRLSGQRTSFSETIAAGGSGPEAGVGPVATLTLDTDHLAPRLNMGMEPWRITGRVFGPGGAALGGEEVTLVGNRFGAVHKATIKLAAGGQFVFDCWVKGNELTDLKSLEVKRLIALGGGQFLEGVAPLDFFRRAVRGQADLGAIQLYATPEDVLGVLENAPGLGFIRAGIDVPDHVDRRQLELRAFEPGSVSEGVPFKWNGATAWSPRLAAGAWDIAAYVGVSEIARIGGVEVREGAVATDSRLVPISLRSKLRTIRITPVVAAGAAAASSPRLEVLGPSGWKQVLDIQRKPRLSFGVVVSDTVDLQLSAEGCRTVRAFSVSTDGDMQLSQGLSVSLDVDSLPLFHGDPSWRVTIQHASSGVALEADLDGTHTDILLGEPGTYGVRLTYSRHGSWMYTREGSIVGTIEVRDSGQGQTFTLTPPSDYFENVR